MVVYKNKYTRFLNLLVASILIFITLILSSVTVSASSDVVDEINVVVPASCSIEGTGQDTHDARIPNNSYNSTIGESTLKITCNDNEGFAVFAIGFTNDSEGKNVLSGSRLGSKYDIATGTLTSGASSQWAMKLATVASPTPTYPVTIQNEFGSFHSVPDSYTMVAKRESSTDIGESAEGSVLKTTYQVYIAQNQPAGSYSGKVKYLLVHPNHTTPFSEDLLGATLYFNEHVDVESLIDIMGGNNYARNSLKFVMKVTTTNILEYLDIVNPNITTWSQLVNAAPALLASFGATNIQSDMQILDVNQSDAYISYDGFYPFCYDDPKTCFLYYNTNGGDITWQDLPTSTGSFSFELGGDSYSFNSFRELVEGMFSGAWLSEHYYSDNWNYEFFRTISIYGGDDIDDPQLIEWLKDNSTTLRVISAPTGQAFTFDEVVLSDPAMRWEVTGEAYSNDYTTYDFDYIGVDDSYGVPIWSFWYYDTTSPYNYGDGFVYIAGDLVVPEYGIDYSAGWYFGNNQNPTGYVSVSPPTIELNGGDDIYNPAFITWLEKNTTN